jgi:hypothetical protein
MAKVKSAARRICGIAKKHIMRKEEENFYGRVAEVGYGQLLEEESKSQALKRVLAGCST